MAKFTYSTSQQIIDDLKIKAIKEGITASKLLDKMVHAYLLAEKLEELTIDCDDLVKDEVLK